MQQGTPLVEPSETNQQPDPPTRHLYEMPVAPKRPVAPRKAFVRMKVSLLVFLAQSTTKDSYQSYCMKVIHVYLIMVVQKFL